jgi:hypothetical protein
MLIFNIVGPFLFDGQQNGQQKIKHMAQTFPFNYADKEYTASFIAMKQPTATEHHISIDDDSLIKEFGQSHIVAVLDHDGQWTFGFPGTPFGSGHTFMTKLASGLRAFVGEDNKESN